MSLTIACKLPNGLNLGNGIVLSGAKSDGAVGGYGLTTIEDASAFDVWKTEVGPEYPPLKNNLIFAAAKYESAVAQAREQNAVESGFEGLIPEQHGVEPTDEMKSELAKSKSK